MPLGEEGGRFSFGSALPTHYRLSSRYQQIRESQTKEANLSGEVEGNFDADKEER
jgi:hypothetical protein